MGEWVKKERKGQEEIFWRGGRKSKAEGVAGRPIRQRDQRLRVLSHFLSGDSGGETRAKICGGFSAVARH
jgi:hypothetical protein